MFLSYTLDFEILRRRLLPDLFTWILLRPPSELINQTLQPSPRQQSIDSCAMVAQDGGMDTRAYDLQHLSQ